LDYNSCYVIYLTEKKTKNFFTEIYIISLSLSLFLTIQIMSSTEENKSLVEKITSQDVSIHVDKIDVEYPPLMVGTMGGHTRLYIEEINGQGSTMNSPLVGTMEDESSLSVGSMTLGNDIMMSATSQQAKDLLAARFGRI
jgi:hypothetical protein